jgi:hypothetical protein
MLFEPDCYGSSADALQRHVGGKCKRNQGSEPGREIPDEPPNNEIDPRCVRVPLSRRAKLCGGVSVKTCLQGDLIVE